MAYDMCMQEVETSETCAIARSLMQTSDLNWLLHRAAQRFGEAMDRAAQRHGVGVRGHLVLSALADTPGRTQLALGAALGLDKTTLTTVLDKLERHGLVVRKPDPADRRARIPEITEAGRRMHAKVAPAIQAVEGELLHALSAEERETLRTILGKFADPGPCPPAGSCI